MSAASLVGTNGRPELARAWAVIAGGGTGGHVYPGLALASELVSRGHDPSTVRFVGSRRGLEARARLTGVFPTTLLPGRGWQRGGPRRNAVANAEAFGDAAAAIVVATALFAKWRPAVVVSLGGYASAPCVVAAVLWRVPVVVVNLDSVPGLVNRWAAKVAVAIAEGVPSQPPPGGPRARSTFTGVPVRPEMAAIDRSPPGRLRARERLGLPANASVVAVCGGSLGALRINEATAGLAELWAARDDVALRHVVGRRDWERFARPPARAGAGGLVYQVVEYEDDMADLYAAADVAVQRAGASTVAELALAGLPSLLVPLPGAPGDHQGANARAMAEAGGAVVVDDAELDGARLAKELDGLLSRPERLAGMGGAARSMGRPQAARDLADLVEGCAKGATEMEKVAPGRG